MLLGDEEGVEVPKAGLNISAKILVVDITRSDDVTPVCRHLFESHFEEDLTELVSDFVDYRSPASVLTLKGTEVDLRGCRAPLSVGAPMALKL